MDTASALGQLIDKREAIDSPALQCLAIRFGHHASKSDLPFQETLQLLEKSTSVPLNEIRPAILGWVVQGYSGVARGELPPATERSVGRLASQVLRLTALHHINRAATGSLQLDKMLSTVVQAVAEAVGSDA